MSKEEDNNIIDPDVSIFDYLEKKTIRDRTEEIIEDDPEIEELLEFLNNSANKKLNNLGSSDIILKNVNYIYEELVKGTPKKRIAESLGASPDMLYRLTSNNKYFKLMCQRAKEQQVEVVRQSLVSKATDKYVTGQKVTPTGKVINYEKYVPADFQAIKFYLLNNDKENYKDKQEIEITKKEIIVDIIDLDEDGNVE